MKTLISLFILTLCATTITLAQEDTVSFNDEKVISWLQKNAIQIATIDVGNGTKDLESLKKTWKDVKVIGLGEATHGTSEFFKMKLRLIEFLVTQMNYTHFVLEGSYAGCEAINDYIIHGKGELYAVLSNMEYLPWDVEEMATMIEWMKNYNLKVKDAKKVRYYGMDLGNNGAGREKVLNYLKKYSPELVDSIKPAFDSLDIQEEKWPFWGFDQKTIIDALSTLQKLITYFTENKTKLVSLSSSEEWEMIYRHLQIMEQFIFSTVETTLPGVSVEKSGRNHYMGQNVLHLIEQESPETKFMVWAHNGHVESWGPDGKNVGSLLKNKLGEKYYMLALQCYQGSYLTQLPNAEPIWAGDLLNDTIKSEGKTMTWYLHSTGLEAFIIDLKTIQSNVEALKWIQTPQRYTGGGWLYNGKGSISDAYVKKDSWDGILFIDQTTPVKPTKNLIEITGN